MSNQDPTPAAPAEVCERLKQLHRSLGSTSQDGYKNERATLTAALLLIEQGEKERERLDWLDAHPRLVHYAQGYGKTPSSWSYSDSNHASHDADSLRQAIDAARAQPTTESK